MTLYLIAGLGLAIVGFLTWLVIWASRAGADRTAAKTAEKTADVLKRQGDAVANAPQGKAEVVDRLRGRGL